MLVAGESGEQHGCGRVDRGEDRGERVRAHGAGARRATARAEGGVARGTGVVRFSADGPFLGAVREYNAVAGGGVLRDARVHGALGGSVAGAFGPSQALVAMPRHGAPPAGGRSDGGGRIYRPGSCFFIPQLSDYRVTFEPTCFSP